MSKGSGNTRSSSSKSPSSLALSAGASSATTSMKVNGVSPELAKARQYMKEHKGYSDVPVKRASFNEKTKTLTLEVEMVSEHTVKYKTGPVTYKNGEAGTTKVIDTANGNGVRGANMSALSIASRIGDKYNDAGMAPQRIVIKQTYLSPEKWRKKYGK